MKETLIEIDATIDYITFPAHGARRIEGDIFPSDSPDEHIWIHKVPFGVTVGLTAWNFPVALAGRKFGPIVPVAKIGIFEEALRLANDSDFGLAAYIFTHDMRRIQRPVHGLDFGEIYVNRPIGEQRQGFHNGFKLSGTGGEDGKYGMENHLQKKTSHVNYS